MRYTHNPQIAIEVTRCFTCRLFYGYEVNTELAVTDRCPHCAASRVTALNDENAKLLRRIAALKGARNREGGNK
jgi:hypothetical protein